MVRTPEIASAVRLTRCQCGRCDCFLICLLDAQGQIFAVAPLPRKDARTFGDGLVEAASSQAELGLRTAVCAGRA